MQSQKLFTTVLLIALAGFPVACNKSANDDTIAKDVQTKVATDPDTKDADVTVGAKDGKVTLTGKVKTPAVQQKIEQIAKAEPGVSGIDDQTAVLGDNTASDSSMAPAAAAAGAAAAPAMQKSAMEKPKPEPVVVPAGTNITIKTGEALGSKLSQTGQTFTGTVAQGVTVDGKTVIPSGSSVTGTVVTAKTKGKIKGEGELSLTLTSIAIKGRTYSIQTSPFDSTSKGKGKRTAVITGGGAAGGALIGGLAGGGKGAAIGALAGAGAGLLGGTLTGNKQIEVPAESAISFPLAAPLTIKE
jgi:BON domain